MIIRHSPSAQIMGSIFLSQHGMLVKNSKTRFCSDNRPTNSQFSPRFVSELFSKGFVSAHLFSHVYTDVLIRFECSQVVTSLVTRAV